MLPEERRHSPISNRSYHYESYDRLRAHLKTLLDVHNLAKRLKTLRGPTVFEFISEKRLQSRTASLVIQTISSWD